VWLITHPDLIGEVLTGKGYTKHYALRLNRMLLGNGLLSSEGDFWLRQRRLIQPPFLRHRVLSHAAVMAEIAARHAARWRPGETRDIHAEMRGLTMAIAARTLFGADVGQKEGAEVAEALVDVMAAFGDRLFALIQLPDWFPTIRNIRSWLAIRRLNRILYGIIKARKEGGPRDDLLSILLHARDEQDGTGMTEKQLRDEAMTLFLAGHETTALALTYTLYLLATNPHVADELHAEVTAALGGRTPTADDLPRLPFTEKVVLEGMRLYPPAYAIGRQAGDGCVLGGYPIPKGGTIVTPQWVVHRDPRWWESPEEFRPQRWTEEMQQRLPKFAYFPFGGGPRVCVGNTFAMVEMVLALAVLASRWRLEWPAGAELAFRARMTLGPAGPVRMTLREAATPRVNRPS
jgi:cytochrome P450